ncbi:MAG: 2-dehydropantoate 2-reductase [Chloroflexota bacterium]|nr:MAG: 2-dehydropantoate 2-reductase [Chloroflexota bacterium]
MRIAIFGTGGVGGYFGGRLAEAGEEVVFIARGDHLRAIQSQGLRVESVLGDFTINPAQATDDPANVGPVDVVLVCVKAWQVAEAVQAIRPLVGPETMVVPLQNGVDAPAELAAVLGEEAVAGGLCGLIAFVAGPGHIRHTGIEPFINFGELDHRRSERIERLHQVFARTKGVLVEVPADIKAAMWRKFLLIATWSGVGAVTRAPIGVLRSMPETREMLEQSLQEIYSVALAHQIALPADVVSQTLAFIDTFPPHGTASMQRDIMAGRPSELASQNGAVVRLGREVDVTTPLHNFIYYSLLPLEMRARGKVEFAN